MNFYYSPNEFLFDYNYKKKLEEDESDVGNFHEVMKSLALRISIDTRAYMDIDDIPIAFGADFEYTQAQYNFFNLDKVVREWNRVNPHMEIRYSTTDKWLQSMKDNYPSLLKDGRGRLSLRRDDGLPFDDSWYRYWSDFYSSRPEFKRFFKETVSLFYSSLKFASLEAVKIGSTKGKYLID